MNPLQGAVQQATSSDTNIYIIIAVVSIVIVGLAIILSRREKHSYKRTFPGL